MDARELEKQVQKLEDIEAIRKLKAQYCSYCDNNYEAAPIAALFTEDAVWDGGPFGRFVGPAAIEGFFRAVSGKLSFAMHYVTNPLIEVDGDRARGKWYLFEPCTFVDGTQAVWGGAYYEDEYVKVNGQWKFRNVKIISNFWTPYEQGWAKRRSIV